ncbi:MAG TPA: hypothetical protein ENJ82_11220, partial [Bacteroidetes bacterium]|nr:hypothetical protein [Bacteroidota bacterium]
MKNLFDILKNTARHGMLLTIAVCGLFLFGQAKNTKVNKVVPRDSITVGSNWQLSDPLHAAEIITPANFAAHRVNQVRLVYSRDSLSDVDGAKWEFTVHYTITFIGQNIAPQQDSLKIVHSNSRHEYAAARVYKPGAPTMRVHINQVTVANTTPLPDDIHLELTVLTERYEFLDPGATAQLNFQASSGLLTWADVPGAEEYDLEWSWIDAASTFDPNRAFERAIRVNINALQYLPNLTYRAGTVYFRIRPVGRFISGVSGDYSYQKYGTWSPPIAHQINAAARFEPGRNLVYSTTFTEGGKFKKIITYADGAGKSRQSLTHLSTDSTTIIAQTEYDHEGRGVLSTIPIPVRGIDLHYQHSLNIFGGNFYAPADFDDVNFTQAMADTSGAAKYFSGN